MSNLIKEVQKAFDGEAKQEDIKKLKEIQSEYDKLMKEATEVSVKIKDIYKKNEALSDKVRNLDLSIDDVKRNSSCYSFHDRINQLIGKIR